MEKGISTIISAVLMILVSVSAIYIVLSVAMPVIDRAYESAAMNEADQNLQLLDNLIREVASEGTGSLRSIILRVSDGDYRIVNTSGNFTGAFQYKIDLKYSPFYAPMARKVGNVKYSTGFSSVGLVGYWKFDERNGTTASDSSGYGNDGRVYNGSVACSNPLTAGAGCPEWVDGKFRKALKFDGVDDYVQVSNSASLNVNNAVTLEAWVYINSLTNDAKILTRQNNSLINVLTTGKIDMWLNTSEGWHDVGESTNSYTWTDGWHQIAGTYSSADNTTKYYRDGVLVHTIASGTTGQINTSANSILIGAEGQVYFNGIIDEARIYDRALTADEIKENYNAKASNYQATLEYSKIILTGTDKFGKGDNKICIEKIGELSNKPLVRINAC